MVKTSFWLSLVIVASISFVSGQTQEASCTIQQYRWAFNSLGLSPCRVAEQLVSPCSINYTIPPLPNPGDYYASPTLNQADPCKCNSIFYSLLSACAACQNAEWLPWTLFVQNCGEVWLSRYPSPIPSGTSVPHWAYLDVSINNTFDPASASADASSPGHSSQPRAGVIAGGVIAGVVGLAVIAGALLILHRRAKMPKESKSSTRMGKKEVLAISPVPAARPTSQQPAVPLPNSHDPRHPNTSPPGQRASRLSPQRMTYTGAPEV